MDEWGTFTVDDDPQGVIAVALSVAIGVGDAQDVARAVAADGEGASTQAIGSLCRVYDSHELPSRSTRICVRSAEPELWFLHRSSTSPIATRVDVLHGGRAARPRTAGPCSFVPHCALSTHLVGHVFHHAARGSNPDRTLTMDHLELHGGDDPEGALAAALVIATAPQHESLVRTACF